MVISCVDCVTGISEWDGGKVKAKCGVKTVHSVSVLRRDAERV
jgi:hypothetical protein